MKQSSFDYIEFHHHPKLMPFVGKYTIKTDAKHLWLKPIFTWLSKFFLEEHQDTHITIKTVRFTTKEFTKKLLEEHGDIMCNFDDRRSYKLIMGGLEFDRLMKTDSQEMQFSFIANIDYMERGYHTRRGFEIQVVPWLSGMALIPNNNLEREK